jgi:hypothetical protein
MPDLPVLRASSEERKAIWKEMRGSGEPEVTAITPYEYPFLGFSASSHNNRQAGVLLAWRVASDYSLSHMKHKGMGWWHFSGAALTIWLTRNWTADQLLSKAVEINRKSAG